MAIIALVLTAIAKPENTKHPAPLDYRGAALACGGMGLAVLGLQQSSVWGWGNPITWICIAAGIAILAAFVLYELRIENPLIQVRIFADRALAADNAILFLLMIPFIPLFFFASMYAQISLGESASETGLYLLIFVVGLTRWGPVDLSELRRRRAFGQIVRAARQLYGRHWRTMVPIGLSALVLVGAVRGLAALIAGQRGVDGATGQAGAHLALADTIESLGQPIAGALVAAVVIFAVRMLVETGEMGFLDSWRGVLRRFWRVAAGSLLPYLGALALVITVIGIPVAIYKFVCWQFVQQEILIGDKGIRDAFRASSERVRGRWWHAVRALGFFWLLSIAAGPVLGFTLIFTNFSLLWINVIGSVVFALLVPYVALGRTLLYFDLGVRAGEEPAKPWRERLPRRAAAAEA